MREQKGFTLIELLIVIAIIGIIAAIAIPNLLSAMDRGKQKKTMMDARSIGVAVELYMVDNNHYPVANDISILASTLETAGYIKRVPVNDGWSKPFQVQGGGQEYTICSGGKDGGNCTGDADGAKKGFNDSIVWANGSFAQWPEGNQQ